MATEADRYWQRKVTANKALANPDTAVTIKAGSLEKEIRKAFEAGRGFGFRQGHKAGQLIKHNESEAARVIDDLFEQLGD